MKKCKECRQLFEPKRKEQKFCCKQCSCSYNGRIGADKTRGVKKQPMSEETKKRISKSKKGVSIWGGIRKGMTWMNGKNNVNWQGKDVGYWALHDWISRYGKKQKRCQFCGKYKETKDGRIYTHWANISGEYKRDLNDYIELCPSCHFTMDRDNSKNILI